LLVFTTSSSVRPWRKLRKLLKGNKAELREQLLQRDEAFKAKLNALLDGQLGGTRSAKHVVRWPVAG
jgi:hypothetical protein